MKNVVSLFFLTLLGFQSIAQFVAYDPENAIFNWWTNGIVLDEVGGGAVHNLQIRIDIEGQIAKVQFAFELEAIPDAAHSNGDNDSLELRSNFSMPEGLIFTGIHMRMNGEMRHGRIIERSKAEVIYDNIVFGGDNTPIPSDPGLLMKDGNAYEFRAFPVGNSEDFFAYIELDALLALNSFNSVSKQTRLPLELFQESISPIDSVSITVSSSSDFTNTQMTGISNQNWIVNSDGSKTAHFTQASLPAYLQFEMVNQYAHQQSQCNAESDGQIQTMWSIPFDQVLNRPSCKYMVVVDVDFANKHYQEEDEVLVAAIDRALYGIQAQMEIGDLFYLIVNGEFFQSYSNSWVPKEGFESAREFAAEHAGFNTDAIAAVEYAHFLMQGIEGQIIILTNDYFDSNNQTDASLRLMANNVLATTAKTRTDIYNFHSGPNTLNRMIAGQNRSLTQAFFNEVCELTNGYYRLFSAQDESLAVSQMASSRLAIESIEADSAYADRYYFRTPNDMELHLYAESTSAFVPNSFDVNYSNGQLVNVELTNLHLAQVDTCLRSLLGAAMIETNLNTFHSQYLASRDYEIISTNYQLLSDFSSLLVVEHDSQYNDTVPRTVVGWPMPLSDETTLSDKSASLSLFPNPTSDQLNIRLSGTDEFIQAIKVFDVSGKLVLSKKFVLFQNEIQLVELGSFIKGMYIVRIETNLNRTFSEQIILQ